MAYGLWLTAYGLRLAAYGLRLAAYGLWLTAYGVLAFLDRPRRSQLVESHRKKVRRHRNRERLRSGAGIDVVLIELKRQLQWRHARRNGRNPHQGRKRATVLAILNPKTIPVASFQVPTAVALPQIRACISAQFYRRLGPVGRAAQSAARRRHAS